MKRLIKSSTEGWMRNHPGYDPIGAPDSAEAEDFDFDRYDDDEYYDSFSEEERMKQNPPADFIYDPEIGYFVDPKDNDYYWDPDQQKIKNYLGYDEDDFYDEDYE